MSIKTYEYVDKITFLSIFLSNEAKLYPWTECDFRFQIRRLRTASLFSFPLVARIILVHQQILNSEPNRMAYILSVASSSVGNVVLLLLILMLLVVRSLLLSNLQSYLYHSIAMDESRFQKASSFFFSCNPHWQLCLNIAHLPAAVRIQFATCGIIEWHTDNLSCWIRRL